MDMEETKKKAIKKYYSNCVKAIKKYKSVKEIKKCYFSYFQGLSAEEGLLRLRLKLDV